jgi:hypothetical protein
MWICLTSLGWGLTKSWLADALLIHMMTNRTILFTRVTAQVLYSACPNGHNVNCIPFCFHTARLVHSTFVWMQICLGFCTDITFTPGGFAQALLSALPIGHDVNQGNATALNAKAED